MTKKGKGSSFERDICKYLTVWNGGDPKKPHFWRQPLSGGLCTIHGDENMSGDIRSISPESKYFSDKFSIECKCGYDSVSLDKHLKHNKTDGLLSFWDQCNKDATVSEKRPLLMYRKLGVTPVWVGIDTQTITSILLIITDVKYIKLHWPNGVPSLYLFGLDDFFNNVTPKIIKSI